MRQFHFGSHWRLYVDHRLDPPMHPHYPSSSSPNLRKESEELRTLIPKGFEVIGALASGDDTGARAAIDATRELRKLLYGEGIGEDQPLIGAISGSDSGDLRFFVSESGNAKGLEPVTSIIQEQNPENCVWENGCLLRCELPIKLPLYYPLKNPTVKLVMGGRRWRLWQILPQLPLSRTMMMYQ